MCTIRGRIAGWSCQRLITLVGRHSKTLAFSKVGVETLANGGCLNLLNEVERTISTTMGGQKYTDSSLGVLESPFALKLSTAPMYELSMYELGFGLKAEAGFIIDNSKRSTPF